MHYNQSIKEVLEGLKVDEKRGLDSKEVTERIKEYGPNTIKDKFKFSTFRIFISQIKSFIVYVLIFAAIVSFLLGKTTDGIVILAIVFLNTLFGFFQEYKAEESIKKLKKLAAPKAIVLRNSERILIGTEELVPGDIILLEEGSNVPADARLIETSLMKVDEAMLTGESTAVEKVCSIVKGERQITDQNNMIFAGTLVVSGRGKAVIVYAGEKTNMGKIAKSLEEIKEKQTPLQLKLKELGIGITLAILVVCTAVFGIGLLRVNNFLDIFLASIALAVAAIPEGLPAVITITLALGTQKMLKKNALIRKLNAVETLGSTTVICTDKTGTLTKNEITVTKLYINGNIIDVTGIGYDLTGDFLYKNKKIDPKEFKKIFEIASLCNNASLDEISDPTEKALLVLTKKSKFTFDYPRIKEIPFNSKDKYMITYNKIDGKNNVYIKGAPEIILEKCKHMYLNGRIKWLTSKEKAEIKKVCDEMAGSALRVLGFAYGVSEENLIFTGLVGMIDPPRTEVKDAIKMCNEAGIRTIMITGDHALTAQAIAKELGITGKTITGDYLQKLSVKELANLVDEVFIYARVSPFHKLNILKALQSKGHIVAMTGDGINDSPALKDADIGIAVNSGSDVAKEVSKMILLDNNFNSIVEAVKEGRGIYDNIKKFIKFLFSCNLAEVMLIFFSLLIGLPLPLIAIQILWMNLVTDGLPAISLGVDPVSDDVMSKKPRKKDERILHNGDIFNVISLALIMCAGTLLLFKLYLVYFDIKYAQTMAFSTMVMFQLFNCFNFRLDRTKKFFSKELFKNKLLITSFFISLILQIGIIYLFSDIFNVVELKLIDWVWITLVSSLVLVFYRTKTWLISKHQI